MLFRGNTGACVFFVICLPSTTPASRTFLFYQGHWMVHPCLIPFQFLSFVHSFAFLDFMILSPSMMSQNSFQKFSVCYFKSIHFSLSPCLQFCRIYKSLYSQFTFHLQDFFKRQSYDIALSSPFQDWDISASQFFEQILCHSVVL